MNVSGIEADSASHRANWAPLLERSAQEVFALMLGENLEIDAEPVSADSLDVTSMVGLAGSLCGLLTLRCSRKCAGLMATKMLGADATVAQTQMEDAIGEVCNVVTGNFKSKVSGPGDGCRLSIPTVITGSNYRLYALAGIYTLQINFLFHENPLVITLKLNN